MKSENSIIGRAVARRFLRNQQGGTIVEFAIVAMVFFIMLCGAMEYGLIMMTKVAIESATQQVSRTVGLGSIDASCAGDKNPRACSIKKMVQEKTFGLVNSNAVVVDSTVVSGGAGVQSPPIPDMCLDQPTPPTPPATCNGPWQENNGAPGYQKPNDVTDASFGVAGELVEIRVSYPWRIIFPLFRQSIFGADGKSKLYTNEGGGATDVVTISSATVIMNEPFTLPPPPSN
ncbi:MAG: TadE/TadG family type IV pilus assembly protein [Pseudomonadota bacterium]